MNRRRSPHRRDTRTTPPATAATSAMSLGRTGRPGRTRRRAAARTWLLRHVQVALASLGQLVRQPLGTLMTTAVMAIAIALPGGLHLLLQQVGQLADTWEGGASLSVYLAPEVGAGQAAALQQNIDSDPAVAEAQLISPAQAMDEFRRLSGFGEALDLLEDNPLPAMLVVRLAEPATAGADAEALAERLRALPGVETVQIDLQWVQRLHAITLTVQRGVWVVAVLLGAAVLLIVGNTIRLEIHNRRDEILIARLVGATDAFIRRPFLYDGLWYGLGGGVLAGLLITAALALLHGPITRLAGLYDSQFSLLADLPATLLPMLGVGPVLGLAGAWLAVGRHLARIEPD